VSPLCKAVHQRVTPELEYLQAKWAAHLPYRQATELLREVLPLDKGISFGSTRRRILAVGSALDAQIKRDIASGPKAVSGEQVRESTTVGCVSVDSAWLSFSSSPKSRKAARDGSRHIRHCSKRRGTCRHSARPSLPRNGLEWLRNSVARPIPTEHGSTDCRRRFG
jgi:hypothetical protein